jgi:hypothetical protein
LIAQRTAPHSQTLALVSPDDSTNMSPPEVVMSCKGF